MSAELFGVVLTGLAVVVSIGAAMFAGFAWMIRRMDDSASSIRSEMGAGFAAVRSEMSTGFAEVRSEIAVVREDVAVLRRMLRS
ncbi:MULTISPECIES: hypothetical protein [Microbacterium]|uniref:hypothetical protein n=1 Tax=Microbacterium TaxID=33882 RepID=UPI0030103130